MTVTKEWVFDPVKFNLFVFDERIECKRCQSRFKKGNRLAFLCDGEGEGSIKINAYHEVCATQKELEET